MNQRHFTLYALRLGLIMLSLCTLVLLPRQAVGMDLNQATSNQLQSLPGIGPKTAAMIVQERERGGAFTSLEDLSDRVRGIGPKRLEALQEAGLQVRDAPSAAQSVNNKQ